MKKHWLARSLILVVIVVSAVGLEYQTSQANLYSPPEAPHYGITMTPNKPKPKHTPAPSDDDELPPTGSVFIPASFNIRTLLRGLGPVGDYFSAHEERFPLNRGMQVVLDDKDVYAIKEIAIPALGLDAPVVPAKYESHNWDISNLRREIAWLENTSLPNRGGNTALVGHLTLSDGTKGPLYYLKDLRRDDTIILVNARYEYVYRVTTQSLLTSNDTSILKSDDHRDQLILITCSNWDDKENRYLYRRAVFADFVSVSRIKNVP